jgi:carboxylesterase type B
MIRLLLWAVFAIGIDSGPLVQRTDAPLVNTMNGSYIGIHSPEYHQDFFLGVPYAQPPVNQLRFRIPQSLNSTWTGTRSAQEYSAEVCFLLG